MPPKAASCFACIVLPANACKSTPNVLWLQMAEKAEQWDCAMTVSACGVPLKALSSTTLLAADLALIFTKLPEALRAKLDLGASSEVAALTRLFGRVWEVITTHSLRAQFNRLPYPLVLRWARQDQLVVDSEDSMVVLLSSWYKQQGGSDSSSPPTDAQCRELSECVRLAHVSGSYILQVNC